MKTIFKNIIQTGLLCIMILTVSAQKNEVSVSLHEAKIASYKMGVTYDKTTHLLFPSPIKYVDLGSDYLIASKGEGFTNVLRIKASVRDFEQETNFSVITEDGKFFNFDTFYNAYPETLSYDLLKLRRNSENEISSDILFEDLKGSAASSNQSIMEAIYNSPKKAIRHIASKSFGIKLLLRGLYIHEGKFYFALQIKNSTNIPYNVDFINFKIADKKNAKRTAVQDRILTPLRTYSATKSVKDQSEAAYVLLLDQFTLSKGQILEIEVLEKKGGRHQKIRVKNSDLINAMVIKDVDLISK